MKHSNPMNKEHVLHVFAESLRSQADADYISSRAAWRMQLREQFLWSALQAIEKQLKAILLFNGRSARWESVPSPTNSNKHSEYGHNLTRLLAAVRGTDRLTLEFPDWIDDFVSAIDNFGKNRYLTKSTYSLPEWLFRLDETVWSIRRYAQSFNFHVPTAENNSKNLSKNLFPMLLEAVNNPLHRESPSQYKPFNGFLEAVLNRSHQDQARKALVWNNQFYGSRIRRKLSYQAWTSSTTPPQERDWFKQGNWQEEIKHYIKL